jgi:hypothetical protein
LFEALSQLSPPPLPSSSSSLLGSACLNSTPELVEIAEQKLQQLVCHLVGARNPREVYNALGLVPSHLMQAVISIRYTRNVDLSQLLTRLEVVTRIILWMQTCREHSALFRAEIEVSVDCCVDSWSALETLEIRRPDFSEWSRLVNERKQRPIAQAQNVSRNPVPEANLPRGRWNDSRGEEVGRRQVDGLYSDSGRTESRQLDALTNVSSDQHSFPLSDSPSPKSAQKSIPDSSQDINITVMHMASGSEPVELSRHEMMIAIQDTVVAQPSVLEEAVDIQNCLPMKANIDEMRNAQMSIDVTKLMKGNC